MMGSEDSSGDGSALGGRSALGLRDQLSQWDTGAAGLDLTQLHAELQGQIAQERGLRAFLRSRSTPLRAAIATFAVLSLCVGTVSAWARPDLPVYPTQRMLLLAGFMTVAFAVELLLALWPLQLAAAPRWLVRGAIATTPLGLSLLYGLPAAHTAHPTSLLPAGLGPWLQHALPCLAVGLFVAAGMGLLLGALDRGGARRALLMATLGGLTANLVLQLHCPITEPSHMLLGHLGVSVLVLGAVALQSRVGGVRKALPRP